MKIFESKKELNIYLDDLKYKNMKIGFVPTMGCIHKGHLSLIKKTISENDIAVCSIFVNPVQFNNTDDFKKYPRTLDEDIAKLESANCDILFAPSEKEIYPEPPVEQYNLAGLDNVMEGKYRPGHFNGVVTVIKRLFDIIGQCNAYFGEKDYQQLVIINHIVKQLSLPVNIHSVETCREDDGLAMSSRNILLTIEERKAAPLLYQSLLYVKKNIRNKPPEKLKEDVKTKINSNPLFKLDYLEIAHKDNLLPANDKIINPDLYRVFIAAYLGNVRLIDNISLSD